MVYIAVYYFIIILLATLHEGSAGSLASIWRRFIKMPRRGPGQTNDSICSGAGDAVLGCQAY